jgi:hypothetical protein
MNHTIVCAAIAAAVLAFAAPAQAITVDPGLNANAPATVQQARYSHRDWHRHARGWNSYAYSPYRHRHCWSARVRTWGHHGAWVRHCD